MVGSAGRQVGAMLGIAFLIEAGAAQGVDLVIARAEALGARTGVAAVELDGTWRHRHRQQEAFVPASNMKLVTAAAVLHRLGAEFEFRTSFALRAGRLVAIAGGDPNFIAGTETAPDAMWQGLVAALQRRGIHAIAGIDLDQGPFTGPSRPPTWPADQLDTYYCAPTGGFVLQQGTFWLRLQPGRAGTAEAALVAPAVQLPIEGSIALVANKKGGAYGAQDRGDSVHIQGRMWQRSDPAEIKVAVHEPEPWFQRALAQSLVAGGVRIDAGSATGDVAELYVHRTPLRPALQRMLEDSSNFDAEQCARVLGAVRGGDGSLAGGVTAVRSAIEHLLGSAPDGLQQVDGSGLSRGNTVTPELLVRVLRAIAARPDAAVYFDALPLAAHSGTLQDRFRGSPVANRVRAKTGWIRGASSLSGVLTRRDGSRCAFAILMNYDPAASGLNKQLKELQEQIVEALDGLPGG